MNEEMMNTTEEMEEEVMSEETTDLVEYEDEDEEPSDGAVALTVLGILGAGAAIGVAGKAIIDKIKASKPKQPNTEKMTLRQKLAIKLAPELYQKKYEETADTPFFEDETDEPIEVEAEVHDIQETPKEEDKEVAEETTNTKKKKK